MRRHCGAILLRSSGRTGRTDLHIGLAASFTAYNLVQFVGSF